MKTVASKLPDEIYQEMVNYCSKKGLTPSKCLRKALENLLLKEGLVEGEAELKRSQEAGKQNLAEVEKQNDKAKKTTLSYVRVDDIVKRVKESISNQVSEAVVTTLSKLDELEKKKQAENKKLAVLEELSKQYGNLEKIVTELQTDLESIRKQTKELSQRLPPDVCEKMPELCRIAPAIQELVKKAKETSMHLPAAEFISCPTCGPEFWKHMV